MNEENRECQKKEPQYLLKREKLKREREREREELERDQAARLLLSVYPCPGGFGEVVGIAGS